MDCVGLVGVIESEVGADLGDGLGDTEGTLPLVLNRGVFGGGWPLTSGTVSSFGLQQ